MSTELTRGAKIVIASEAKQSRAAGTLAAGIAASRAALLAMTSKIALAGSDSVSGDAGYLA
ncbi:MAG: hypothetical protein WB710_04805 [Stellaceae bacterium]